ncbi:MAG: hypothetical protein PHW76_08180 [Alphaproteobacteria bacterium]|nr:hypothetical protein [Alphaproteobacteria bacterium]
MLSSSGCTARCRNAREGAFAKTLAAVKTIKAHHGFIKDGAETASEELFGSRDV